MCIDSSLMRMFFRSTLGLVSLLLGVMVLWYFINSVVSLRVETVELTLNWAQLVSIIGSVELNWPPVFQSVSSAFGVLVNCLRMDSITINSILMLV